MFFMNRENIIRDLNREQEEENRKIINRNLENQIRYFGDVEMNVFVDKSTIIRNEENKIKPVFKN